MKATGQYFHLLLFITLYTGSLKMNSIGQPAYLMNKLPHCALHLVEETLISQLKIGEFKIFHFFSLGFTFPNCVSKFSVENLLF